MSAQPIDPRLEAGDAAQYRGPRQQPPAPYPAPVARPDAAQPKPQLQNYREGDQPPAAHPYYYPLQPARSPSDDLADRRESLGGADMVDMSPNGQAALDAKRSRACEACRGLKVRCDMDNPEQPCKRCAKAGRQCVVTQPSRRRHKKADTRVAELEKKIDALTAVIQAQQYQPDHRQPPVDAPMPMPMTMPMPMPLPQQPDQRQHDGYEEQERRKRRRLEEPQPQPQPQHPQPQATQHDPDKQRGWTSYVGLYSDFTEYVRERVRAIVDWDVACDVFAHFRDKLLPEFPAIALAQDATPELMLDTKPLLFLCILAAGCLGMVDDELHTALTEEVFDCIATAAVRKGLKTVEIIQGMHIAFLWHKPPERPAQANFYTLIHMAVVMGFEVGLGKPYNPQKARRGFGGPGSDLPPGAGAAPVDSDTLESRRTWLCCYYTAASVAQVLRRPNLLRWSNYMQECVDVLEKSAEAGPTDGLFCQHVRIQRICEEISVSFAMEDPSATSISILDPKVAYTLNVLEEKLDEWDANVPQGLRLPTLMFFKHVTSLYLHEIAMHVNHNTDDFRVPFTEASLRSGSQYSQTLTQKQMASIEACLKATHNIIATFCDFPPSKIAAIPALLYFVRLIYALVVLIKMHVAATSPGSELGKMVKPEDIKVSESIDRVWQTFRAFSNVNTGKKAYAKAQHILGLLHGWIASHPSGDGTGGPPRKDAATRNPPPQRFAPRENDSLRVLSEAATAGAEQAQQRSWTFDSPYGAAHPGNRHNPDTPDLPAGASSDGYPSAQNYPPTVTSTPGSITNTAVSTNDGPPYTGVLDPSFAKQNGGGGGGGVGPEWTSGLDFEQAIDVALSNLDYSGDLFGSFFGDGADAFQIPPDAAAGNRW